MIPQTGSYNPDADIDEIGINNISYLYPDPILIDGIISSGEWDNSVNITKWYMDADPENYDGYNYMYLTEDRDNVYIALDLVSDQTNDEAGEWVGLWLNTNETVIDDLDFMLRDQIWHDALNEGMESLIFDVDNNQVMPYFNYTAGFEQFAGFGIKTLSGFVDIEGTFEGTIDDVNSGSDSNPATMTSVWNGTHYVYRLDIEVTISEYFDLFTDMYVDESLAMGINSRISNNVTISEHYYTVRNSTGHLLLDNPKQTMPINTGTSYEWTEGIEGSRDNYTQDDTVLFSYIGVNDVPFKTNFDSFFMVFKHTPVSILGNGAIRYPYSTINNFDMARSFGPSQNNASDHRMFEFKIPKSELEGYEQNTDLGLLIGGYGTLTAVFPNSHHWLLANGSLSDFDIRYTPYYYYHDMPLKGWNFLNDPVLNTIDPDPSDNGSVILDWNDDAGVVNWTVIRHTSMIDETSINDVDIIAIGLTSSQYTDSDLLNGTYYYGVVAVDSIDYLYISNIESVVVSIPAPYTPPSDTDTTDTSDTTTTPTTTPTSVPTTPTTSDEVVTPGFTISVAVVAISVAMIYKRRRN